MALLQSREGEGIAAVRRPQQRAPFRKDAADRLGRQRDDGAAQESFEAELDADDLEVVLASGRADRGADDRVETRTVAPASEDSDRFLAHRGGQVFTPRPKCPVRHESAAE